MDVDIDCNNKSVDITELPASEFKDSTEERGMRERLHFGSSR